MSYDDRFRRYCSLAIMLCLSFVTPSTSAADTLEDGFIPYAGGEYDHITIDPYGAVLRRALWENPKIPVCWDQASTNAEESRLRLIVRRAVEQSWPQHSAVEFLGWDTCSSSRQPGVHIIVSDSEPRTVGIGKYLNGRPGGVVLNFQLEKWRPACQADASRDNCIRYLAVHEFGHVLGFVHEHVRTDAPRECRAEVGTKGARGDWKVTVYDAYSIMNYCASSWNLYEGGPLPDSGEILNVLSIKDRSAVGLIYKKPSTAPEGTAPRRQAYVD